MKKVVAGLSVIGLMLMCGALITTLLAITPDVSSGAQKKKTSETSSIVDINTADQKALESLPGVGKATAKAIIAGRPYKSVDDLKRVKGMSDKKIKAIKDKVTVSGSAAPAAPATEKKTAVDEKKVADKAATAAPKDKTVKTKSSKTSSKLAPGQTVNINTASQAQIEALPGIGPKKAQAIINGRPYDKPEDIMKVKGIKQGIYNKIKDNIVVR
jgi:competence protein ComEA